MNYQLIKDIIQHDVDSIGFKELVTVGGHYMDGNVIQQDILFTTK